MYDLGIVGGMGSLATTEIFNRIIKMTNAKNDSEHMKVIVLNNPKIPDRTANILNNGKSPVLELNKTINDIRNIGAKNIIMGCNTAHFYVNELDFFGINFINIIDETLKCLINNYKNKKIVILGTTGLIKSNIFLNNVYSENLNLEYLNIEKQKAFCDIIYQIKGGKNHSDIEKDFIKLLEDNDKVYVLACTELSLFNDCLKDFLVVDAMDCLVKAAIIQSGYELHEDFK